MVFVIEGSDDSNEKRKSLVVTSVLVPQRIESARPTSIPLNMYQEASPTYKTFCPLCTQQTSKTITLLGYHYISSNTIFFSVVISTFNKTIEASP